MSHDTGKDIKKYYDSENRLAVSISETLSDNVQVLTDIFNNCGDVVQKSFVLERKGKPGRIHIIYIDGLTNNQMIESTILKPLLYEWRGSTESDLKDAIFYLEAQTVDISEEKSFDNAVASVLKGDTAIFVDGYNTAFIVSSKKLPLRSISDNDKEGATRGPQDSFNEGIRSSTALIRRRIRDPKLKVEQGTIGERSRSDYALMYLEDVVMDGLVDEIKARFDKYDIDAIFDSGMVEHLLEESRYSPFPVFQSTTRPDKAASAITEGRVVIVVDNSPEVIIAPSNLNMLLQSSDDYYNRWTVATFARIIRYVAAFIAIAAPGFYIAAATYHTEMMPEKLLYAIAAARSAVTCPVIVEVLLMEFFFELLREAGLRLPGNMGNTIGVVGGLIVGQSAVEAGLVSTIVVIVVALTAIASFALPNEEFASVFRLLKFFIIITSALLGLYGFVLGLIIVAIHLAGLTSFGIPYMMPAVGGSINSMDGLKDYVLRAPLKDMKKRPFWADDNEKVRLKKKR